MIDRLLAGYLRDTLTEYEGSLITRLAGLVKTVETDRFTKPKVSRFPVSVDEETSYTTTSGKKFPDLVPDKSDRLIVYFEGGTATPSGVHWNSRLRLVAWGNADAFEINGRQGPDVIVTLMNQLIQKVTTVSSPRTSPIAGLSCKVISIPEAGTNLFSRYTYQEMVSQYLIPPYFSFALDLQLTYHFQHGCIDSVGVLPVAVR